MDNQISAPNGHISPPGSATHHGRDALALVVAMTRGDAESVELIFEAYLTAGDSEEDAVAYRLLQMQHLAMSLISVAAMCAMTAGSGVDSTEEVFALIRQRLRQLTIGT
jgi:hypothetical protein